MTDAATMPIFDGHNDVLLRLFRAGDLDAKGFFERGGAGHVDLPRMLEGGFAAGFFAVFVPSPKRDAERPSPEPGEPPLGFEEALPAALAMASILFAIERRSEGVVKIVRDVADIRGCMGGGRIAAILHMEGAEAVDPELRNLDLLHAAGLRSLGPVWSRRNAFGTGVPFDFPGSPDIGAGLTEAGRALVAACNERGILLDLSHLNEKGFWDVAHLSIAPLVATHSNVHALTPAPRNLTDAQLDAVRASGGVVGLNYGTCFLRDDGRMNADTPLAAMLHHLDHMLRHLGEDGVALGSDFDGAVVPAEIGDASGNQRFVAAMRAHGYGEPLIEKICWRNWLSVLERTWRT
ncbi:MAG: dipeptidase [Geminicoccaceae bacterium]|nr:dipeptidase [Geminicoccaceae bacterium]